MAKTEADLGQKLVSRRLLTAKQLERVRRLQSEMKTDVLTAVLDLGLGTDGVLSAFAQETGVRVWDPKTDPPDRDATRAIDERMAIHHGVIPVGYAGERLLLAVSHTKADAALDDVAAQTGLMVEPVLASRQSILRAIDEAYRSGGQGAEASAVQPVKLRSADAPAPPEDKPAARKPRAKVAAAPAPRDAEPEQAEVRAIGRRLGVDDDEAAVDLHELLEQVLLRGASDLHLTAGVPPVLRLQGELVHMTGYPVLGGADLQKIVYGMLQQKQREKLETDLELDLSYSLPGKARFRVNVYMQRGAYGAAFRLIPFQIKSVEDLGLPGRISEFGRLPRGLVVLTGPTGSGKSTTLASLVDIVNRERACHIMTIEDPIEFLHAHKRAVINQREIGTDTHGFAPALRHVLRQDPDVILVGEMRDLETIHMAVTAAETGHLVLATLHTQDAPQTVDRIIDVFPPHQQQQIRVQLSGALMGVVAQQLLQTRDGNARAVAAEVLVVTSAVRNLIREGKTHQIYSSMQAGGRFGMITMDAALAELVRRGTVTHDAAKERCHNVEEFLRLSHSSGSSSGGASRPKARVVG